MGVMAALVLRVIRIRIEAAATNGRPVLSYIV